MAGEGRAALADRRDMVHRVGRGEPAHGSTTTTCWFNGQMSYAQPLPACGVVRPISHQPPLSSGIQGRVPN